MTDFTGYLKKLCNALPGRLAPYPFNISPSNILLAVSRLNQDCSNADIENEQLFYRVKKLELAIQEFVDGYDSGHSWRDASYLKFKKILERE